MDRPRGLELLREGGAASRWATRQEWRAQGERYALKPKVC